MLMSREASGNVGGFIFQSPVKLTRLRMFVCVRPSARHSLTVLSDEQVRNAPDCRPAANSPGTSGNIWGRAREKGCSGEGEKGSMN